jgi:hypothetical protein
MEFLSADRGSSTAPAAPDAVHAPLCGVVAEMMGAAARTRTPGPHVSFAALGAGRPQARELAAMLTALFGSWLTDEDVLRSPTPDSLARTIEAFWFAGDGTVEELAERIAAIAADE